MNYLSLLVISNPTYEALANFSWPRWVTPPKLLLHANFTCHRSMFLIIPHPYIFSCSVDPKELPLAHSSDFTKFSPYASTQPIFSGISWPDVQTAVSPVYLGPTSRPRHTFNKMVQHHVSQSADRSVSNGLRAISAIRFPPDHQPHNYWRDLFVPSNGNLTVPQFRRPGIDTCDRIGFGSRWIFISGLLRTS